MLMASHVYLSLQSDGCPKGEMPKGEFLLGAILPDVAGSTKGQGARYLRFWQRWGWVMKGCAIILRPVLGRVLSEIGAKAAGDQVPYDGAGGPQDQGA